ncbi:MAG: sulfatase-like hydrolase/transferase, partial [Planctomycetota bacterium]
MKSISHLLLLLLCACAPLREALSASSDSEPPRPNVLLLMVDDLNSWLLGDKNRYSGKVIAPNIRRLADSGVLFSRAYTASPVCSPSRTAMLSGVRPWQSGLYDNGLDIGASQALKTATSLPALFKGSGYTVWSYGKIGHGWDFRKSCDEYMAHKRDPAPPDAPFLPFTRGEQDWGPTHLAEEDMNDTKLADAAIRQLGKEHDRPFLIACGLFHPHMPWYVPQKYLDMFPPDVPLPEILDSDLDDVPPLGRAFTAGKSRFVDQVRKSGLHASGVRAYLATTAYADAQMGRVLDAL